MQSQSPTRRSASPHRDPAESGRRGAGAQRHQRLARRQAAQLAEAQLEIREWRGRQR